MKFILEWIDAGIRPPELDETGLYLVHRGGSEGTGIALWKEGRWSPRTSRPVLWWAQLPPDPDPIPKDFPLRQMEIGDLLAGKHIYQVGEEMIFP